MRDLHVHRLSSVRIPQAYPLVQTVSPALTLDGWTAYAQPLVTPSAANTSVSKNGPCSGILVVDNEQGYIVGLCTYRVQNDLFHGRTLHSDNLVALDLFNSRPVVTALAEAIESLARAFNCTALQTSLPERRGRIRDSRSREAASRDRDPAGLLGELGHRVDSLCLCKQLTPAAK